MSKKNDFTSNLTAGNISSFKPTKNTVKKKVSLLITADEKVIANFKILAFNYYKERKILRHFNWNSFLEVCILNLESIFSSKGIDVEMPDEDLLIFYKKPSKKKGNMPDKYTMEQPEKISFTISVDDLNRYYALMHTYYTTECNNLTSFSVSYFFVDLVRIIGEIPNDQYKEIRYE